MATGYSAFCVRSIFSQSSAPTSATAPATASAKGQPQWTAIQGVRLGEIAPPRLAPVFIMPDKVPACVFDKSLVEAQYAPTAKYRQPAPIERQTMAASAESA